MERLHRASNEQRVAVGCSLWPPPSPRPLSKVDTRVGLNIPHAVLGCPEGPTVDSRIRTSKKVSTLHSCGRDMGMQRKLVICGLWLHFIILLNKHNLSADCMKLPRQDGDITDCLFEDRDSCNTARKNLCKWCGLSRKCYPKELVSSEVGANGNRFSRRKLQEVQDCSDIIYKDQCRSLQHCRWCKSEVLDDGCFTAWEARRLPVQVFACSNVP